MFHEILIGHFVQNVIYPEKLKVQNGAEDKVPQGNQTASILTEDLRNTCYYQRVQSRVF